LTMKVKVVRRFAKGQYSEGEEPKDFDTQSDKYVEMRKSFGVNDPYALKEIGEAHYQGAEYGYQYAVKRSDNVIKLIVKMAKKDIAFTEEEAVKFYHKEMEE